MSILQIILASLRAVRYANGKRSTVLGVLVMCAEIEKTHHAQPGLEANALYLRIPSYLGEYSV